MDFLKKHYEKVLLGAVLLGLAGAVGFLFFKIASEKEELERKETELTKPRVTPLPELDLGAYQAVLQRLGASALLDLSVPHKLFNPMPWQKTADGRLIKLDANNVGPKAVVITKLNKLHFELTLDTVSVEDSVPKFLIGVKREAAPNLRDRAKTTRYCKVGDKNDLFLVKEIRGPQDNPTNVVVVLNDTGEEAVLTTDKTNPFRRVDGYTADLKYGPENRILGTNRRANTPPPLTFNGETYDIVAINKNEVILKARSNQKKWSIPYNGPD
jgi:hypothetical protein